jgi:hypothetical protein
MPHLSRASDDSKRDPKTTESATSGGRYYSAQEATAKAPAARDLGG